jgi:hypothetical protein
MIDDGLLFPVFRPLSSVLRPPALPDQSKGPADFNLLPNQWGQKSENVEKLVPGGLLKK